MSSAPTVQPSQVKTLITAVQSVCNKISLRILTVYKWLNKLHQNKNIISIICKQVERAVKVDRDHNSPETSSKFV